MTEILILAAEMREEVGTGAARALRRKGMVPATIYGAGKDPISISIEEKEITKHYRKPQYISQLIQLEIGKKKYRVLPKAIELNPITEIVRHADFVFLEEKMQKMQVPVVYENKETCIGIKRGGYFNTVKRLLTILCPIDKLPRKIEIDTEDMGIGTSIKAKEAILPEGAKLLEDPELVIASIIGKRGKTESLDDEDDAKAAAKPDAKAAAKPDAKAAPKTPAK
jgi:large subunit ribosomal protein L25